MRADAKGKNRVSPREIERERESRETEDKEKQDGVEESMRMRVSWRGRLMMRF